MRLDDLVIITVAGNSMMPTLSPGDRLVVEIYRGGPSRCPLLRDLHSVRLLRHWQSEVKRTAAASIQIFQVLRGLLGRCPRSPFSP